MSQSLAATTTGSRLASGWWHSMAPVSNLNLTNKTDGNTAAGMSIFIARYTHARTHARTHACTRTRTRARTRTHARTYVRAHARTHARARARAHAHTHTHTHQLFSGRTTNHKTPACLQGHNPRYTKKAREFFTA